MVRRRRANFTLRELRDMKSLWKAKWSYKAIAGAFDCSRSTVNNLVTTWNLGYETATEGRLHSIRSRGFRKTGQYSHCLEIARNPDHSPKRGKYLSRQERFEREKIEPAGLEIPKPPTIQEGENLDRDLKVRDALEKLREGSARMYLILYRRFYLEETLEKIGYELGLCRERVRQIESRALKEMRGLCAGLESSL